VNSFLAVTFAWSLVFAFFVLRRIFSCPHDWQLVDKTEFLSALDEAKKLGVQISNLKGDDSILRFLTRRVIAVLRCTKCGGTKTLKFNSQ
jgi:hypothetical protein